MPFNIKTNRNKDKILLIDFQNLSIRNLMKSKEEKVFLFWRFMTTKSLLGVINKFSPTKVIIALESKLNWRNAIYPPYKAHRKEDRKSSPIDWDGFYKENDKLLRELEILLPFYFISINGLEADDLIAYFTEYFEGNATETIIVSSDKDFHHLMLCGANIYDPMKNVLYNPSQFPKEILEKDLFVKICTADGPDKEGNGPGKGDNIPNLFRGCGEKRAELIWELGIWHQGPDIVENYNRNKKLMDLRERDKGADDSVYNLYNRYEIPYDSKLFKEWLSSNNMNSILEKFKSYDELLKNLGKG